MRTGVAGRPESAQQHDRRGEQRDQQQQHSEGEHVW
jgi:hypothetical protein